MHGIVQIFRSIYVRVYSVVLPTPFAHGIDRRRSLQVAQPTPSWRAPRGTPAREHHPGGQRCIGRTTGRRSVAATATHQ